MCEAERWCEQRCGQSRTPVPTVYNNVRCANITFVRTVCLITGEHSSPLQGVYEFLRLYAEVRLTFCRDRASRSAMLLPRMFHSCRRSVKTNGKIHCHGSASLKAPSGREPWVCANNLLRRKIVQTTSRTVRQLVARTPCPYRGLNDFRSFVRSRKIEQT